MPRAVLYSKPPLTIGLRQDDSALPRPSGLSFAQSVSLRSARALRVHIPKNWRSRASPTIKLLAPEVGSAGACLALRVELRSICLAALGSNPEGSNPEGLALSRLANDKTVGS